jgi:hypothetical protein
MACPVRFTPYEREGPNEPVILPRCRHTISRGAIMTLIQMSTLYVRCPLCRAAYFRLDAGLCLPNWEIKRSLGTPTRPQQSLPGDAAAHARAPYDTVNNGPSTTSRCASVEDLEGEMLGSEQGGQVCRERQSPRLIERDISSNSWRWHSLVPKRAPGSH